MILKHSKKSSSQWQFEAVTSENIRLLNHFLKQHAEPTAGRGDWNYWIKQHNKIVAVARLLPVNGNVSNGLWLRGVYVIESERHQGLGSQLITWIHQDLQNRVKTQTNQNNQACSFQIYAFPYSHLSSFYSALGYQSCLPDELPDTLQQRFEQAQSSNKGWLCMKHEITAQQ